MYNFALLGAAGYIAPRHMKAIKDTGNNLVVAMDTHDAVGIIDKYFPDSAFFVEFERLDRHVEKLKRMGNEEKIHYVSIASPNYLHDAHIRFALRVGAHAICEKPLVLEQWNLDALKVIEKESGTRVNAILQLRLHPSIKALKEKIDVGFPHVVSDHTRSRTSHSKHDIDLTYITSRGRWYLYSWKGNTEKSGGVTTNIGIHFFDMLQWVFGPVQHTVVHLSQPTKAAGYLELEKARVRWFLSIDRNDLPEIAKNRSETTYRSITIDGDNMQFSEGFSDLHTTSYEEILKDNGFSLDDAEPSIKIAHDIRNTKPIGKKGEYHPFLKLTKR